MSTETPAQIIAAADAEVREADTELARLEQAVIDDHDVTPDQIEQARARRRFAGLRRQAAEKKAAAARQNIANAEAARRRDAFLAAIADCDTDDIEARSQQAEQLLYELAELVDQHNTIVMEGARQLAAAVVAESRHNVRGSHVHNTVTIDGTVYAPIQLSDVFDRAVNRAKDRHMQADQERRRQARAARPRKA